MSQTTDTFGLFETLRVRDGHVEDLARHQARLEAACRRHWQVGAPDLLAALVAADPAARDAAVEGETSDRLLRVVCGVREGVACVLETAWRSPFVVPARVEVRLAAAPRQGAARDWCDKRWPRRASWPSPSREVFETLLHDRTGLLLEGTRSSVFVCRGGRWFTPPTEVGLVPGIVRSRVIEVAARQGLDLELARVPIAWLSSCEALVVAGTGMDLVRVHKVEGRVLAAAPGGEFVERCAPGVRELRRHAAPRVVAADPGA